MEALINQAFEDRAILSPQSAPHEIRDTVQDIIQQLDVGKIRVAEKINNTWVTNQTFKKAILLYFKLFLI